MRLWCVGHEEDPEAASVEAEVIYKGNSLCMDCFESRGGYLVTPTKENMN